METVENTQDLRFVVPNKDTPGYAFRQMAYAKYMRLISKAKNVYEKMKETKVMPTDEEMQIVDNGMMAKYEYLSIFVHDVDHEKAIEMLLQCTENDIDRMARAVGMEQAEDPKAPASTPETLPTNSETLEKA